MGVSYVVPLELAARDSVQDVVNLVHRHHLRVAEDRFVDGPRVDDCLDNELADVPSIGEGRENVSIAGDGTGEFAVSDIVE